MGYIEKAETDELHLPSDAKWVVQMKKKGDYGAQLDIQDALIKINAEQMDAITAARQKNGHQKDGVLSPEVMKTLGLTKVEVSASKRAMTLSMIVSWNLTDENDQPLSVTAESLNKLKGEDGEYLTAEAQARMPARKTEEERRPFGKRSSSRSAPSQASAFRRHGG